MIKHAIRKWLGVDEILTELRILNSGVFSTANKVVSLDKNVRIQTDALGRIIAKIDSAYAGSELTLERKTESDKLGDDVIAKLMAEDRARRQTEGKF